ncbi:MAG: OmpA family protein [Myxococcus sp.]|nr:OmpA family protein [Myxococcus sp.]
MHKLSLALTFGALTLAACSEDLAPITKTWTETVATLTTRLADVSKTAAELKVRAGGVVVPADDREGTELKGRLDAAVASADKALADAQALIASGTASVNEALGKGKVAGVQTAIDKARSDVGAAIDGLKTQLVDVEARVSTLEARLAAAAQRASEAAAAAAAAVAPPTVDVSKAGEADFPALDFKADTDELDLEAAATRANLESLVALMNSCDGLAVEVEGHTSKVGDAKKNKALSAKRAQAVTRHLINVGKVSPSKIKKTWGYGGEKPALEEPEPGSAAEKAMDAAALAEARGRNERIRLRIVKPCPAGK